MRRYYTLWLTLFALFCIPLTAAWGQFNYYMAASTGEPIAMDGANVIFRNGSFQSWSDAKFTVDLGFTFKFSGRDYTQVTLSTNGVVYPGSVSPWDNFNSITGAPQYPLLAPYWDYLRFGGGAQGCTSPTLHYLTKGAAGNRMFVVEFFDVTLAQPQTIWAQGPSNPLGTFQVRLYENGGKIEFWYGRMSNCDQCNLRGGCYETSASIGIAASPREFISVSYASGNPEGSMTTADDLINITGDKIQRNTLLTFASCEVLVNGRIGEGNGGTVNAANGDTFFSGSNTQLGESTDFRPISVLMASSICSSNYTLTISGPAAGDYYFNNTPGLQTISGLLNGGNLLVPVITFRPTAAGLRQATLTVTGAGLTRTYNLAAYAPLVSYIGNVPEGGTLKMNSGDALLVGKRVNRRSTATYQPFSLYNNTTSSVPVTYTITGASGQYTITPGVSLAPGATTTPTITFNALGFGPQVATLTVTAGTETRTFTLNAISAAPGGEFRIGARQVDTSSSLFNNVYGCTGGTGETIEINMVNTGYGPFTITSTSFYRIDTTIGQGTPPFNFLRDGNGNLIPSTDYVLSLTPNGNTFQPFTLNEGESRTLYLRFISQAPGKRYARAYFYTNSENTAARDIDGVMREGILAFDVFGRGSGARLSDRIEGGLPRAIVFQNVKVGTTKDTVLKIVNSGTCSLTVSMNDLAITSGDVDEFSITNRPANMVLAPGESREIGIRFKPRQAGSRRASLRLVTNDSTLQVPGITERGTYYVDLFGGGGTALFASGYNFGQGLINGTGADRKRGMVRIVNTLSAPVTVNGITIEGTDAGQFIEDPANPWPARPLVLQPGQEITLGVIFTPTGDPGARTADVRLDVVGASGSITAPLSGEAGTRMAIVNPTTINFPMTTIGKRQRRMVSITNSGTMPLTLTQPEVVGQGSEFFTVGTMARTELAPGQTEQVEITFSPRDPGTVNAFLEFGGNMTNGPIQVELGGSSKTRNPNDPNIAVTGRDGVIEDGVGMADGLENYSTSSVGTVTSSNGMMLMQSAPNPAQRSVEIRYTLPRASQVELVLYDAQGRELRVLDAGQRNAGERVISVNVSDLANGTYFYQLRADGESLSRTMSVAK